jgi:hypothetical protein
MAFCGYVFERSAIRDPKLVRGAAKEKLCCASGADRAFRVFRIGILRISGKGIRGGGRYVGHGCSGVGLSRAGMRGCQEFCGGDKLAGMALRVVGAVDEESSDGCGEGAAAYGSGPFEVGGGEGADA